MCDICIAGVLVVVYVGLRVLKHRYLAIDATIEFLDCSFCFDLPHAPSNKLQVSIKIMCVCIRVSHPTPFLTNNIAVFVTVMI